jgi:hypothetical protein
MISIPTAEKPIAWPIRLVALAILRRVCRLSNRLSVPIFHWETAANPRLEVEVVFIGALLFALL